MSHRNRYVSWLSFSVVVCAIGLLSVMWGCGGGGAGGPADAQAESALIQSRLSGFLGALNRGQPVGAYLSQRMQTLTNGGEALSPLTVYDFGSDLGSSADNEAHTFHFDPADIVYLSPEMAIVPTWLDLSNGNRFHLKIQLVKVSGV